MVSEVGSHKGPASLPCFVLLVAAAIILAAKAGTSIDRPVCLVGLVLYLVLLLALVEVDFLPTNTALAVYFI